MFTSKQNQKKLDYVIHEYSSSSSHFTPEKILQDDPTNSSSRWTTTSADQNQFITLRLLEDSIVTGITFGKFHKMHVCNIKVMNIYSYNEKNEKIIFENEPIIFNSTKKSISLNDYPFTNTKEKPFTIFSGGLKNDAFAETFPCKFTYKNGFIVSKFIKIHPMQAWGANFNYSIWHVKIHGISRKDVLYECIKHNYYYLTTECNKIILKYLKNQKMLKSVCAVEEETKLKYENEMVNKIKEKIVKEDFEGLEVLMKECVYSKMIERKKFIYGEWTKMKSGPTERGGHSMISVKDTIYLHGGWNGKDELADFWEFDISNNEWKMNDRFDQKRACHKMIHIKGHGKHDEFVSNDYIMFLGRYIARDCPDKKMNISLYCMDEKKAYDLNYDWNVVNIYDHQVTLADGKIYVFGGKSYVNNMTHYGGLYLLKENKFEEVHIEEPNTPYLQGRVGHGLIYYENKDYVDIEEKIANKEMVFTEINKNLIAKKNLIVIGGQRDKTCYRSLTFYDLESDTVYKIVDFPIECENKIVHRSAIIENEIYILFCYETIKDSILDKIVLYSYNIQSDVWNKIPINGEEPMPRSGHTFIYSTHMKAFYLFGGNIGVDNIQKRVNDFWQLKLKEITDVDLERKLIFLVRKHKFLKLINKDVHEALEYLQTNVFDSVNHKDKIEETDFKKLCCEIYKNRRLLSVDEILEDICKYFVGDILKTDMNLYELL